MTKKKPRPIATVTRWDPVYLTIESATLGEIGAEIMHPLEREALSQAIAEKLDREIMGEEEPCGY